jgi:hypothetical protein
MLLRSVVHILPFVLLFKKWPFTGPLMSYYVSPNFLPPPPDSFRSIICPRHYHLKNYPLNCLRFFWPPSTSHWLLRSVISPVHLPLETSPLKGRYLLAVLTPLVLTSVSLYEYNFFSDRSTLKMEAVGDSDLVLLFMSFVEGFVFLCSPTVCCVLRSECVLMLSCLWSYCKEDDTVFAVWCIQFHWNEESTREVRDL